MTRIVLVNCRGAGSATRLATEHLGLASLAAVLARDGFGVTVLDANYEPISRRVLLRRIQDQAPALVGFTLYYNNADATVRTIEDLRKAGCRGHVTLGGHHATFNALELLAEWPSVDSVVRGEGEGALLDLARAVSTGQPWDALPNLACRRDGQPHANPCRPLIADLNQLPHPHREAFARTLRRTRTATVLSSRGCFGRCTFCSIRAFYRFSDGPCWRPLDPCRVVDEIEALVRAHGVNRIRFMDDEFAGPGERGRRRARAIAEEMLRRRLDVRFTVVCRPDSLDADLLEDLLKAGLECVDVGVESWVPRQLALYGKGVSAAQNWAAVEKLERLGIPYRLYVMPIDPYVTPDELRQNLEAVARIGLEHFYDNSFLTRLIPFRGTTIHERLRKEGVLSPSSGGIATGRLGYRFQDSRIRRLYPHIRQLARGLHKASERLRRLFRAPFSDAEAMAFGAEVKQALTRAVLDCCLDLLASDRPDAAGPSVRATLAELERAANAMARAWQRGKFERCAPVAVRIGRRKIVFPRPAVREATTLLVNAMCRSALPRVPRSKGNRSCCESGLP